MKKILLLIIISLSTHLYSESFDSILADVDGAIITLSDYNSYYGSKINLQSFKSSSFHQKRFEKLINHQVLLLEAKKNNIKVTDTHIDEFINNIKSKNKLTNSQFVQLLNKEGKTLSQFRKEIEYNILSSQIASSELSTPISVSDSEINYFIKNEPSLNSQGKKITLRRIFIPNTTKNSEKLIKEIKSNTNELNFKEQAAKNSLSRDSQNGGYLGIFNFKDLSPALQNHLKNLSENQISDIFKDEVGYSIFFIEKMTIVTQKINSKLKELIRQDLMNKKMQSRAEEYFKNELQKKYYIEKLF